MSSLASLIISALFSWYVPSFFTLRGIAIELSVCSLILTLASSQLWNAGPNPIMFGMVIGSGWFILNRISDLVFPVTSE